MPEPVAPLDLPSEPEPYNSDESLPLVSVLPEEGFDEKYSKRLEAPLALITAILVHVIIGAGLLVLLAVMADTKDKNLPPMQMTGIDGLDEYGEGSPDTKGEADALKDATSDPNEALKEFIDPEVLPKIQEQAIKLIDPDGNLPITASNAQAINQLSDAVRKKLYGNPNGKDKGPGKGVGGVGSDSTLGRNMRWTLRFKVESGRDYLNQLQAMDAKILVPIPNTERCILVEDLKNPSGQQTVGQDGLGQYAGLLKFADSRRAAIDGIAGALALDFTPKTFFAVFSKEFEADLARKETRFKDRRPDDIAETIFVVSVRGGQASVEVVEQKLKR